MAEAVTGLVCVVALLPSGPLCHDAVAWPASARPACLSADLVAAFCDVTVVCACGCRQRAIRRTATSYRF